ncbi:MAG: NrfD/PsrC family molybdoenzyme membrane anchor subunit [Acidimicrobiales bacterium]
MSVDGRRVKGADGRRVKGGDGASMVPRAQPSSYYGRPILQRSGWKARNIAGYFFLGGVAAGSSLLAAGGDLTGRPALRRAGRLVATAAVGGSVAALVKDLGRPDRFLNMLRVFRPTSPMSVGSWILASYGPLAGLAAVAELRSRPGGGRLAGLGAAALAPALASYTAVILADTAVPTWHDARRELPFVFAGSSASASGGLAMALVPPAQAGPARNLAVIGSALELGAGARMEQRLGLSGEPLREGRAGRVLWASKILTAAGALVGGLAGRHSRSAATAGGLAMAAGSACVRFATFYAGIASSEDPRYTVEPQRQRLDAR